MSTESPDIEVAIRDSINITCTIRSVPVPSFSWSKDNTVLTSPINAVSINETTVQVSLSLNDVQASDSGIYQCHANNSRGSDQQTILLTVMGKLETALVHGQKLSNYCTESSCTILKLYSKLSPCAGMDNNDMPKWAGNFVKAL